MGSIEATGIVAGSADGTATPSCADIFFSQGGELAAQEETAFKRSILLKRLAKTWDEGVRSRTDLKKLAAAAHGVSTKRNPVTQAQSSLRAPLRL